MEVKSLRWDVLHKAVMIAFYGIDLQWFIPSVEDMNEKKPVSFRVKWEGFSPSDPLVAIDFAEDLKKAGFIAQKLTEMKIQLVLDNDDMDGFKDYDDAQTYAEFLAEQFRRRDPYDCADYAQKFVKKQFWLIKEEV